MDHEESFNNSVRCYRCGRRSVCSRPFWLVYDGGLLWICFKCGSADKAVGAFNLHWTPSTKDEQEEGEL
jgi:transposase